MAAMPCAPQARAVSRSFRDNPPKAKVGAGGTVNEALISAANAAQPRLARPGCVVVSCTGPYTTKSQPICAACNNSAGEWHDAATSGNSGRVE